MNAEDPINTKCRDIIDEAFNDTDSRLLTLEGQVRHPLPALLYYTLWMITRMVDNHLEALSTHVKGTLQTNLRNVWTVSYVAADTTKSTKSSLKLLHLTGGPPSSKLSIYLMWGCEGIS